MNTPRALLASLASFLVLATSPLSPAESPRPFKHLYAVASGVGWADLDERQTVGTLVIVWETCDKGACIFEAFVNWVLPNEDGSLKVLGTAAIKELDAQSGILRRLFYDSMDGCFVFELGDAHPERGRRLFVKTLGVGKYQALFVGNGTG